MFEKTTIHDSIKLCNSWMIFCRRFSPGRERPVAICSVQRTKGPGRGPVLLHVLFERGIFGEAKLRQK